MTVEAVGSYVDTRGFENGAIWTWFDNSQHMKKKVMTFEC